MNDTIPFESAQQLIEDRFREIAIPVDEVVVRAYPEETVFVVYVRRPDIPRASELGIALDGELQAKGHRGFVTVRTRDSIRAVGEAFSVKAGVSDPCAADLLGLLTSRARTSESQPSLDYVQDAAENLTRVLAARHSLIFGRRGAGKTALMLEAKRQILLKKNVVAWINVQTFRNESLPRATLWILAKIVDVIIARAGEDTRQQVVRLELSRLRAEIEQLLGEKASSEKQVVRLLPYAQSAIKRLCDTSALRLYIFLDDFHYIERPNQPLLLDYLHSCVRDADAWLKVAAVRHFARWYQNDPPRGLQAGQDAVAVDLDLTLQDPARAKTFLESVLEGFAKHVGIPRISALYAQQALDRLLLASGAVPRDYLVLAASALTHARERNGARQAGRQDVTRAAGDIAKTKIAELEDDSSSDKGTSSKLLRALEITREFCIADRKHTVFLVEFKDKEQRASEYGLLQGLMDLRLVHLANTSVSDTHESGVRFEAYVLDLSQYSGERLKKRLHALDFEGGNMVLKATGTTQPPRIGDTPRKLITILRSAPRLELTAYTTILEKAGTSHGSRRKRG